MTFRFPSGYVVSSPARATITANGSRSFLATNFSVNPLPRNIAYPFNFSIPVEALLQSNSALAGHACSSYPSVLRADPVDYDSLKRLGPSDRPTTTFNGPGCNDHSTSSHQRPANKPVKRPRLDYDSLKRLGASDRPQPSQTSWHQRPANHPSQETPVDYDNLKRLGASDRPRSCRRHRPTDVPTTTSASWLRVPRRSGLKGRHSQSQKGRNTKQCSGHEHWKSRTDPVERKTSSQRSEYPRRTRP